MADTDILEQIASWLADERDFEFDGSGAIVADGDPPLEFALTTDAERAVITHVSREPGAGTTRADAAIAAVPERGTTLEASAAVDREGVTITVSNHVYLDGLNRQAFVTALNELVAAVDMMGGATVAETRIQEPVEAVERPADTGPVAAATVTTGQQPIQMWAPTHRVPSGGLQAWDAPDPSQQPSARLQAGVQLVVAERRGDWARVIGENGWTGWVDVRRLAPLGGGAGINIGGLELNPLPLVGALALLLSAFLPWISRTESVNSLDVPLAFLWDIGAAGRPNLGWLVIALAVVALGVGLMRRPNQVALMVLGVIAVAAAIAFVLQMNRGVSDIAGEGLFDWLGFAPWFSLGGGLILLAAAATTRPTN